MACQHKTPCAGCPFRKSIAPGKLGGSGPTTYVGQTVGPFWLPCHMSQNYKGKQSQFAEVSQCAGAAIYRANIGVAERMPSALLSLPQDPDLVFASQEEFLAHHGKCTLDEARQFLKEYPENYWLKTELYKQQVRKVL